MLLVISLEKLCDIIIFNGMENWKSFMLKLLWDVRLISYPMLDCRIDLQCSPSHLVNFIQSVSEENKIMERSRKALFLSVMNIMYCLEEDLEQANSVCKHGFLCAGGFYKKKKTVKYIWCGSLISEVNYLSYSNTSKVLRFIKLSSGKS